MNRTSNLTQHTGTITHPTYKKGKIILSGRSIRNANSSRTLVANRTPRTNLHQTTSSRPADPHLYPRSDYKSNASRNRDRFRTKSNPNLDRKGIEGSHTLRGSGEAASLRFDFDGSGGISRRIGDWMRKRRGRGCYLYTGEGRRGRKRPVRLRH